MRTYALKILQLCIKGCVNSIHTICFANAGSSNRRYLRSHTVCWKFLISKLPALMPWFRYKQQKAQKNPACAFYHQVTDGPSGPHPRSEELPGAEQPATEYKHSTCPPAPGTV